ncbi:MAG: hypothetical protein EAZ92_05020 [Candidatus Kapaibacterium sp.]|nr:MAG: hypothetical protein EAZ92_05020 [Candidatus Kapabacteria bacterium]
MMSFSFHSLRREIASLLVCVCWCGVQAQAQSANGAQGTDNLVRAKLRQVALGNAAAVRAEMPELVKSYPNDAGVQFLNATLLTDGNKALPLFVRIVREHPQSTWADDAQWRVVQIYALRKDTTNARSELQTFRKKYPASEFLLFSAEIVKSAVGLPPSFGAARPSVVVASSSTPPERPLVVRSEPSSPKAEAKTESVAATNDAESATRFTLQVGLYATKASAEEEVERFRKARMKANIIEKNAEGAAKYAVTVGVYSSREAADKAKPTVQKICNCVPFVMARQ